MTHFSAFRNEETLTASLKKGHAKNAIINH